jgi:hypothetical protein
MNDRYITDRIRPGIAWATELLVCVATGCCRLVRRAGVATDGARP